MNILDENIPWVERIQLRKQRVSIRQIGYDVGRKGLKDQEIIPLLHGLNRPTFFTLDLDYYSRRLLHERYCLVHLNIEDSEVAEYVRRLLRHNDLNTKSKRMGCVMQASAGGIYVWRLNQERGEGLSWH